MPHVIVKMYAGKSDRQKSLIAEEITHAVMKATGHGRDAVSVSIEDIAPKDWSERVFKPDIIDKPESLYEKPGYNPL